MKSLTIASLLLSSALVAGMGYNMPSFSEFDADGNGEVTKVEFEGARAQRAEEKTAQGKMMRNAANAPSFEEIDTDESGYIDEDEFEVHQKNRLK
jgi:Ca2+-binding EF-hand superfamily protein